MYDNRTVTTAPSPPGYLPWTPLNVSGSGPGPFGPSASLCLFLMLKSNSRVCNFSFGPRAGVPSPETGVRSPEPGARRRNEKEVEKCVKVRVPGKRRGVWVVGGGIGGVFFFFWAGGVIAWLVLPACCLTSGEVSLKNNFAYKLLAASFNSYAFPPPPPFFSASSELHFG